MRFIKKYFNEKHIPFNNIEKQNAIFLTDHLEYENIQSHTINHNNVENYNNIQNQDDENEDASELDDDDSESESIS